MLPIPEIDESIAAHGNQRSRASAKTGHSIPQLQIGARRSLLCLRGLHDRAQASSASPNQALWVTVRGSGTSQPSLANHQHPLSCAKRDAESPATAYALTWSSWS